MAHVVSITNMKGGVGKTTLTANLAYCLADNKKKRVLMVDVDPQFNLTQYCMSEKNYEEIQTDTSKGTVFDILVPEAITVPTILKGKKTKSKKRITYPVRNNLYIIPSSINLIDFIDQRRSGSERLLSNYLKSIKDEYDYVFIDCPPTSTILSRAAYLASDAYLIPMGMDYFSVMGIPLLQKDINNFTSTYGVEMKGLGIVRTKFLNWTAIAQRHKVVVQEFSRALNIKLFNSAFRQRQEVQNALSERKFIIEHAPRSESASDIRAIADEFIEAFE
jgi:chromosome partitioning protein